MRVSSLPREAGEGSFERVARATSGFPSLAERGRVREGGLFYFFLTAFVRFPRDGAVLRAGAFFFAAAVFLLFTLALLFGLALRALALLLADFYAAGFFVDLACLPVTTN